MAATALESTPRRVEDWIPLLLQLSAGCRVLADLSRLAKLSMQSDTAFRTAAACQLVFVAGRRATAGIAAQLEAAAAVRVQLPDVRALLHLLCTLQLRAVVNCTDMLSAWPAAAAAAFARSTAKPA